MKLLIVSATKEELEFYTPGNEPADVLITGVGIPATFYHLQKKLRQVTYDLVIQAGLAGSFTSDLFLGEKNLE